MEKQVILLALCALVVFTSCKTSPQKREQLAAREAMEGCWLCADVLDKVAQARSTKRIGDFPPYTELVFSSDSNVTAINGQVEMVQLAYERKGSIVQISEFYGNGSSALTLLSDSVLVFNDEVLGRQWRYVKAADTLAVGEGATREAFASAVNQILLAGEYSVVSTEKPYTITFRSNGYIFGSPQYTRYSICFSGDCANFSDKDLIYLANEQQGDYYGWQVQGDVLTIYTLSTVNEPDEMPDYEYGKPIWVMKKK